MTQNLGGIRLTRPAYVKCAGHIFHAEIVKLIERRGTALKLPLSLLQRAVAKRLTVQIVDLEEEDELLVGALAGELVHRLDELGHAHRPVLVPVEDAERPLHEEGLQKTKRREGVNKRQMKDIHFQHQWLRE